MSHGPQVKKQKRTNTVHEDNFLPECFEEKVEIAESSVLTLQVVANNLFWKYQKCKQDFYKSYLLHNLQAKHWNRANIQVFLCLSLWSRESEKKEQECWWELKYYGSVNMLYLRWWLLTNQTQTEEAWASHLWMWDFFPDYSSILSYVNL